MRRWLLCGLAGCFSPEPTAPPSDPPVAAVDAEMAAPPPDPAPAPAPVRADPALEPPAAVEPVPATPSPPAQVAPGSPRSPSSTGSAAPPATAAQPPKTAPTEAAPSDPGPAQANPAPAAPIEAAPEPARPVTYRLGRRSYASVLIKYDRKATIPGHDHVLVSRDVRGQVTWTEGNPSACKINVEIPASSLLVDPPGSRKRAGLEGETSEGDRKAILENALGKRQLDAAQFPTLSFVSTACLADGDRVKVSGMLTIHGVGKAVSPSMNIQVAEGVFTARGRLAATHADFGMEPYTAVLGALRNDPALSFDLEFVGE